MSRRDILTAVELVIVASGMASAVALLGEAAYHRDSLTWTPAVLGGACIALALLLFAVLLFVGRLAIEAAPATAQAWREHRERRERQAAARQQREHPGRHAGGTR